MYKAKFVTDADKVFDFSFENNIIFDISPLSGIDTNIKTSQGFLQQGERVESLAVQGLQRTISGKILKNVNPTKQQMFNVFTPYTSGKLYFNNRFYCDCVVKSVPDISVGGNVSSFFITLYCPYPFWLERNESIFELGGYKPAFKFPVNYSKPHRFGIKNPTAFINCVNNGIVKVFYSVSFKAETSVRNYGLVNAQTLKYFKINDTLEIGQEVKAYRKNGKLFVEKIENGKTKSIFEKLDEDSSLFELEIGDNLLKATADSNLDSLSVTVSFNNTYSGVYDGM